MPQNVPKLRSLTRQHKVIELRAQGKTIANIATELDVSEKTIDRDLKSQTVTAFIDELIRQQVFDINDTKDVGVRLQFRSDLLDKMLPKKQEIKQDVQVSDNAETTELLRVIAAVDKKLTEGTTLPKNNLSESIHQTETNPETGGSP